MTPPKGPNKRAKGKGTLFQRDNGYFVGTVRKADDTGKRHSKSVGSWDEDVAEARLDALVAGEPLPENLAQLHEVKAAVYDTAAANLDGKGYTLREALASNPYRPQ
jgi:hypothetical protein